MKRVIWFMTIVLGFVACEDEDNFHNDSNENSPVIHLNDSIDINADNKTDFIISYTEMITTDDPSSGRSIIGLILPVGDNQVLYHNKSGHLFLKENDIIRKNENANSTWNDYTAHVVSIDRHDDVWDENWTVQSQLSSDYFLGIKLKNDDLEKIGWILLDINTKSGKISVSDKKISSSSELKIEK